MKRPKTHSDDGLAAIYNRPGFLLRRCHQLSVALFLEECERQELTPAQFGVLTALETHSETDQIGVARLLGLDRTTTSNVVGRLEMRGLIRRVTDTSDRRKRMLRLTAKGRRTLEQAHAPAGRAGERLLSGLSAAERRTFLALLQRISDTADGAPRAQFLPQN